MDQQNIITIIKNKENTITFDVSIEGISKDDVKVRWAIKTTEFELMFPCQKTSEGSFKVVLPPVALLESTTYPFTISVIADGYYFEPASGVITVVPSPEVYTTEPKNTSLESPLDKKEKKEEPKEVKKEEPKKEEPKKEEPKKEEPKKEEPKKEDKEEKKKDNTNESEKFSEAEKIAERITSKPVDPKQSENDNKVKAILESYKEVPKKKPRVFKKGKIVSR